MRKTYKHFRGREDPVTGERIVEVSEDGGKTWKRCPPAVQRLDVDRLYSTAAAEGDERARSVLITRALVAENTFHSLTQQQPDTRRLTSDKDHTTTEQSQAEVKRLYAEARAETDEKKRSALVTRAIVAERRHDQRHPHTGQFTPVSTAMHASQFNDPEAAKKEAERVYALLLAEKDERRRFALTGSLLSFTYRHGISFPSRTEATA